MKLRRPSTLVFSLGLVGMFMGGCKPDGGGSGSAEVQRLTTALAAAQGQVAALEKELTTQKEQATSSSTAAQAAQKQTADNAAAILEKDGQIRALQKEATELRKSEAQAYAEASASLLKGVTSTTLNRYQQFVRDFPKSPLVADANRAIAELNVANEREAQWRKSLIDPKRPEREALKHFADEVASPDEIAPLVRRLSKQEVVALLGTPNKSYRDGTEIGYVNKVIDPATGEKGTLIISFQSDRVVSLRVGYQGKEIKP